MSNNPRLNKQINAFQNHETETHYNINRDYNPVTGRYIQSDPIGFDGGVNSYIYVNGNSLINIDLNGKMIHQMYSKGNIYQKYNFYESDKIMIRAWSPTVGIESFYYTVTYHYVDQSGNIVQWVPYDWKYAPYVAVAVGLAGYKQKIYGFHAPSVSNRPYYVTGYYWTIEIPTQPATNANSNGYYLDIASWYNGF